ncbi:MFS transporter [Cellulomonas massiliensis]|uniref:MFS transporter n=1 Tax=Cellulomonas massiliensis TaxID=1465811 RepID=UPI0003124F24|nr:MFS transporter [Cellulomonas massiliensis]
MTGPETPARAGAPASLRRLRRVFLVLTALRWLPVGLTVPVTLLLPLGRGLSLADVGVAIAMQGLLVLALELPTGALADTLGRRRVLLAAAAVGVVATGVILAAHTLAAFAVGWALQGVFRALDSGPLEAWFVDAALEHGPQARVDRGLSAQGVVLGVALGGGALAGGALVAWHPVADRDALALPVAVALALQVVSLVAIACLMHEPRRTAAGVRGVARAVRSAPGAVRGGLGLLRRDHVLLCLVAVELSWGFGIVAFETLTPVRVADLLADDARAAAVVGPATAAAWLVSAGGAALLPWCSRRWGVARCAMALRVLQGATVVGIGLATGLVGVLAAYLACYAVHGASSPAHMTLLHARATGSERATVLSLNSMVGQPAAALGSVVLTALAGARSLPLAFVVAGAVLASAAPLYLPARRAERGGDAAGAPAVRTGTGAATAR